MQDFPTGIAYCITVACSASIIYFWSGHSHKAAWQVPCQLLLVGDLIPALSLTVSALTRLRSPCHWMPPLILRSNYYCVAISQIPFTCTSSSSSNFRGIFVAAMKAYEKKTKTGLLTHPLATQPQSCESFSENFAVLHNKVNEFEKIRSHNKILSSWLNPTINVPYASSAALGQRVGPWASNINFT